MASSTSQLRRTCSVAEAAKAYGIHEKTIRRRIASGDLLAYRVGPRLIRVDLDDLDRLARRIPAGGSA